MASRNRFQHHSSAWRIKSTKDLKRPIGNWTRGLSAYSSVPQQNTLQHTHMFFIRWHTNEPCWRKIDFYAVVAYKSWKKKAISVCGTEWKKGLWRCCSRATGLHWDEDRQIEQFRAWDVIRMALLSFNEAVSTEVAIHHLLIKFYADFL
jgi:hypothetical protein